MRRKELFIVLAVIAFGLAYNGLKHGHIRIGFYEGCSVDPRSLLDRGHPNDFPQEEIRFGSVGELEIHNKAGSIEIEDSDGVNILVRPVIRVHHIDRTKAAELVGAVQIKSDAGDGGSAARVWTHTESYFPYRRIRVIYKVFVPKAMRQQMKLDLGNRYGNIKVNDWGGAVAMRLRHGDIAAENLGGNVNINHRYGWVVLRHLGAHSQLEVRSSKVRINDATELKIHASHSRFSIQNVEKSTRFGYASHSFIDMVNGVGFTLEGRHTRIKLKNITNEVDIKNSHDRVYLEDIDGMVNIKGNDCKIRLERVTAPEITLRNAYDHIEMKEISAKTVKIDQANGNLDMDFLGLDGDLGIKAKHSKITLAFPGTVRPSLDIQVRQGDIINQTNMKDLVIVDERSERSVSQPVGTPQIVIKNKYGKVILKNNSRTPPPEG